MSDNDPYNLEDTYLLWNAFSDQKIIDQLGVKNIINLSRATPFFNQFSLCLNQPHFISSKIINYKVGDYLLVGNSYDLYWAIITHKNDHCFHFNGVVATINSYGEISPTSQQVPDLYGIIHIVSTYHLPIVIVDNGPLFITVFPSQSVSTNMKNVQSITHFNIRESLSPF